MSKKTVDAELLSKERENIFDDYYNIIEGVKLDNIKKQHDENHDYSVLIKSLTILERNIDDLASGKTLDSKKFEKISELIIACLREWLPIFELLIRQPNFITSFSYNLQALAILIANCEKYSTLEFHKDIIFFCPSRKDKLEYDKNKGDLIHQSTSYMIFGLQNNEPEITSEQLMSLVKDEDLDRDQLKNRIEEISKMLSDIEPIKKEKKRYIGNPYRHTENVIILAKQIYDNYEESLFSIINLEEFNDLEDADIERYRAKINRLDIHPILEKIRVDDKYIFEWDIEVIVHGESYSSSQIGFLMWSISKALESIDGVSVYLEDWGNGSKRFNLKVIIQNWLAKEEVKQVLDKGRKAAESQYLDKPIEEVEKIKAEKEKTIKETEGLLDKEQSNQLHEIEIQRKQIELQDLRMELELKKIQLIKGYSELIKDGILINDSNFQIKINEVLYLKKEPQLALGENIEIISEKEIKRDKNNPENENQKTI